MTCFILIHAGWCGDRLVSELEKPGHRALAPNLPVRGSEPIPIADVTMAG